MSAKTGEGVDDILEAIVHHIPAPKSTGSEALAALAFDSWYDEFKGVVSLIAVKSGYIKRGENRCPCRLVAVIPNKTSSLLNFAGDRITSAFNDKPYEVNDVGVIHPTPKTVDEGLGPGQVGYITCGMKDPRDGESVIVSREFHF